MRWCERSGKHLPEVAQESTDPRTLPDQIVLGTAQLGLAYGRGASGPVMARAEAWEILDRAWSLGIRAFDTADAYGEAPARLSKWISSRGYHGGARVVTKVKAASAAHRAAVEGAMEKFRGTSEPLLLTHGQVGDPTVWREFESIVQGAGWTAGQSIYDPDEVAAAATLGSARVQIPGNALNPACIRMARSCGVQADVRSVFLQGVLLETPMTAEKRVTGAGAVVQDFHEMAASLEVTPVGAAMLAVWTELAPGDRLVLGVDSVAQLEEIVVEFERCSGCDHETRSRVHEWIAEARGDPDIADPRKWKAETR